MGEIKRLHPFVQFTSCKGREFLRRLKSGMVINTGSLFKLKLCFPIFVEYVKT